MSKAVKRNIKVKRKTARPKEARRSSQAAGADPARGKGR